MNQRRIVISIGGRSPGMGGAGASAPPRGILSRVVGFAVGAVVLVGAFVFSLVLFAVLLSIGAIAGGYLWWKTRALRAQLRAAAQAAQRGAPARPEGQRGATTIEGEFAREADEPDPRDGAMRPRRDNPSRE